MRDHCARVVEWTKYLTCFNLPEDSTIYHIGLSHTNQLMLATVVLGAAELLSHHTPAKHSIGVGICSAYSITVNTNPFLDGSSTRMPSSCSLTGHNAPCTL
jgi:hypothetical protein